MRFAGSRREVAATMTLLRAYLTYEGKSKEANPLRAQSYAVIKKEFGIQHDRTQKAGGRLVILYQKWGKDDQPARVQAELEPAETNDPNRMASPRMRGGSLTYMMKCLTFSLIAWETI